MSKKDIAVIGVACRFPGGADTPSAFWDLLISGTDAVTEIPADRFDKAVFGHPDPKAAGKSYTFQAGTLGDVSGFDAAFFGLAPREAEQMDPQQRLLIEMTWEALESGGQIPAHLAGTNCAVYVGISATDYGNVRSADPASVNAYFMLGSSLSIAANRLSYIFDLNGPSIAVDTACSSSLVALNEAVHAIGDGRASMAVVGGVHMLLSPYPFIGFSRAGMLSPYGRCRAFDKLAKGYVRAEGGGVVVLKPLADALRDGDPIRALIRGIGINSDGHTHGIALPSSEAQEALLRRVYADAEVDPEDLIYFEAHGTGTAAGDPAEAGAIGRAIGVKRAKTRPLPIGSVKSNIGHLEPASGMAGLIKGLLVLQHHEIPPSLHCDEPNPEIDFAGLNVEVARKPKKLKRQKAPAFVGINSFGFGGTNAHVIVQEFRPGTQADGDGDEVATTPLFISARSEPALKASAKRLAKTLQDRATGAYYDVAYTLAHRRTPMEHRLVCRSTSAAAAIAALRAYGEGTAAEPAAVAPVTQGAAVANPAKVAFVFSGNGSQWAGMGVALLTDPVFNKTVETIDRLISAKAGWSVIAELKRPAAESRMADTRYAQPLLLAVQIGMMDSLAARGLRPGGVTGHSVGEVAAAYASGALTLEQAVMVILERSAAQGRTRGAGLMAAVDIDVERAKTAIAHYAGSIEIAAINSPQAVTLSGDGAALLELGESLKAAGANFRMLDLDYAFHSHVLDRIEQGLCAGLATLKSRTADIPFYSTVSGTREPGDALDAEYWWHNARQPVRFSDAIAAMAADGYQLFVEVGPHPIMQGYIRQILRNQQMPGQPIFIVNRDRAGPEQLDAAVDTSYVLGAELDRQVIFPRRGRFIDLPTYPWQRESHWFRPSAEAQGGIMTRAVHPFLGAAPAPGITIWDAQIDAARFPFLADHVVGGSVVFPAAAFIETALAAARACFGDAACDIEEMQISRPLVLEGETKAVRLAFDPEDGTFTVKSRPRLAGGDWSQHVSGRLVRSAGATPTRRGSRATGTLADIGTHYSDARTIMGLDYGPQFQTLKSLSIDGREAVAELGFGSDASLQPEAFILHPALLDGCFQALLSLARLHVPAGDEALTFLPYRLHRLRWYRSGTVARCHLRLETLNPRSLVAAFQILDAEGEILAEIDGFRFQQASLNVRRPEDRFFQTIPVPLPLLHPSESPEIPVPAAPVVRTDGAMWSSAAGDRLAALFAASAMRAGGIEDSVSYDRAGGQLDPAARDHLAAALALASQSELIERSADGSWRLKTSDEPAPAWRAAVEKFPHAIAEITLIAEAGARLEAALRGRAAAGQATAAMLEHLALASPSLGTLRNAGIRAVEQALHRLPSWHRPSVLVLTAGAPAVREHFISELKRDGLDLTVATIGATPQGEAVRDDHGVRMAGFTTGSREPVTPAPDRPYDIVLVDDLLRQGVDPTAVMRSLTQVSRDRTLLLFADATSALWVEFCLSDGTANPPNAQTWQGAAAAVGLDVVRADGVAGGRILIARCRDGVHSRAADTDPAVGSGPWLILADDSGFEETIANALGTTFEGLGKRSLRILPATHQRTVEDLAVAVNDVDSWSMLLQELAALDQTPAGLIYLLGLTEATPAEADRCWPVLAFLQARDRIGSTAPLTLALVTAGAHAPASDRRDVANPLFVRGSGQLWGLGRVLQNEKAEIRCRMIDLAFGRDDSSHQLYADSLAAEILSSGGEAEIALTQHGRFGLRTRPWHGRRAAKPNDAAAIRLSFTPGSLERLTWRAASRRAPRDGEVEIAVEATGLNFRDVMFAMGILPDEAVERGFAGATLGLEAAGRIVRVGAGVQRFKVGDAVMCFAAACFGSHVTVTERAVMSKPAGMGFAEAATIPTAYFTVYYALKCAGQIRAGERILVHGGAGAVGLAAIRYALHVGAEVYATAGNDEKRMIVALSGVPAERIFDSRSLAFADKILEMTNGEGVDLVLNSLAGEAIQKNLAILKPFGRLLELGKRDFYANSRVGLRPFRNNVSFHGIDVDQLMVDRPQLASELFAELSVLVENGVFTPLPYRQFESTQVVSAFRHLQQSRHVGKIVVSAPSTTSDDTAGTDTAARLQFDPGASYLVTGGLSGFGLATAEWLAAHGARHLVLVGRRGTTTPGAGESIERLKALGASVDARAVDMADTASVHRLVASLDSSAYPLRGVFHAAAVFDDGVIDSLTQDRFERVVAPKALGAHALDRALGNRRLDHFVLFSSISTLFGNPGQANYVAANMEMETIALQRRRRGLAATAICFPPIEDAGYLLRNTEVREALRDRLGVKSMTAAAALQELERLLAAADTPPVIAAVEVEWRAAGRVVPALKSARFRDVFNAGAEHAGDTLDLAGLAASLSPAEWVDLIGGMIVEIAAEVLRAPAASIDRNKPIFDLGMDSLMLVEMKLLIDERLGVDIPQMSLTESATINRISDRVAAALANRGAPSAGTSDLAETAASLAAQHSESVAEPTVAAAVTDVQTGAVRSRLVT